MDVTQVRILPAGKDENPRIKAYVTIVLDESLLINNIKVIQGEESLFLAMPSKKLKSGEFHDLVYPINREMRAKLETVVLEKYSRLSGVGA